MSFDFVRNVAWGIGVRSPPFYYCAAGVLYCCTAVLTIFFYEVKQLRRRCWLILFLGLCFDEVCFRLALSCLPCSGSEGLVELVERALELSPARHPRVPDAGAESQGVLCLNRTSNTTKQTLLETYE